MNTANLNQNIDILVQLTNQGLYKYGKPLRLHLGCGQQYFEGYINIDYPPSEHIVRLSPARVVSVVCSRSDIHGGETPV